MNTKLSFGGLFVKEIVKTVIEFVYIVGIISTIRGDDSILAKTLVVTVYILAMAWVRATLDQTTLKMYGDSEKSRLD